ncbi:probable glycosyltransferase At3g07620 [Cornus florida]|uniref:probable glycosyltransferase At3g07620 n=1 Tax=Cornus florida TaxID=4283 RepID=UPI00289F3232|nr:probable glycosyltransferase At3g07620 [Cornus florida]
MLSSIPCLTLLFVTSITIFIVVLISLPSSPWSWTSSSIGTISSPSLSPSVLGLNRSLIPPSQTTFFPSSKDQKKQWSGMNLKKGFGDKIKRAKKRDAKLEGLEASLATARALIRDALINQSRSSPLEDSDYVPQGDIYRNAYAFHRSYLLMESLFKIFVYEEGEPPIFHNGFCKDIYSLEGFFINLMEMNTHFRTRDPDEAHVYFLPFSLVMMMETLFDTIIRDKGFIKRAVRGYVHTISTKYPYWNKSLGADHFMLACHDWGPIVSRFVPQLSSTAIRVLCNANTSEGFNPKKDASCPNINLPTGKLEGLTGGLPPSNRMVLAFFAGGPHGNIRLALFQHWKEKDEDVRVYEKLPQGISYNDMMKKSKYCICPSGWEVASPRVVEAIYAECVPVLISQHYVPPFSDVLNWDVFSIQVSVSDIPNLKRILMGIPQDQYLRMQERLKYVQRHLLVNDPPKRYDVFHMLIHSIWLRRMNVHFYSR